MSASTLPIEVLTAIDEQCDRFEAAWLAGDRPRIEDFLAGTDARFKPALFEELLQLDALHRRAAGEAVGAGDYLERFQEFSDVVKRCFAIEADTSLPDRSVSDTSQGPRLRSAAAGVIYSLLALQNNLVRREDLLSAAVDWAGDRRRSLPQILKDRGFLRADDWELIDRLFTRYVARSSSQLKTELASASLFAELRQGLRTGEDAELSRYLAPVAAPAPEPSEGSGADETTHADSAPRLVETRSRLRILRHHARGGLGEVSVARDEDLNREVAFKRMQRKLAPNDESRGRFVREAEITGTLEHPGVVPVYGMGLDHDGEPFYAMRFIHGKSLRDVIQELHAKIQKGQESVSGLGMRSLLERFLTVCDTLSFAHSRGVLHRDLKPANIMLGDFGETLIVDWGLAKDQRSSREVTNDAGRVWRSGGSDSQTAIGAAMGTPQFMSPEQAVGDWDTVRATSDVYSLGATLYNVLTGRPPIARGDTRRMLDHVRAGTWSRPREVLAGIPRPLESICLKAMAIKPEDRYASAAELGNDVRRCLADEPVIAHQETVWERCSRMEKRHRGLIRIAGVALLLLALGALGSALAIRQQRDLAIQAQARAEQTRTFLVSAFRSPDPEMNGREITVASLLDRAAEKITTFASDPRDRVAFLTALGETYLGLGDTDKALAVAQQARQALPAEVPVSAAEEVAIGSLLGQALHRHGQIEEGIATLEATVTLAEARLPEGGRERLGCMSALGLALLDRGRFEEAIDWLEKAFASATKFHGAQDEETLASMTNLASAYQAADRTEDSLRLLDSCVQSLTEVLGAEHPRTLNAISELAIARFYSGDVSKALTMLKDVLASSEKVLGPDHHDTITSLANLAVMYDEVGQPQRGLSMHEEVVSRMTAKLGGDHPETIKALNNLAVAYDDLGQARKALPIYERTLATRTARWGERNPDTLLAMHNLALSYLDQGDSTRAVALLERVLELRRVELGKSHRDTLESMNSLGDTYRRVGRVDLALPLLEETLRLRRAQQGEEHPDTLISLSNLAAHLAAGQPKEAIAAWTQVVEVRRSQDEPDLPRVLKTMHNLGSAYFQMGDLDRALDFGRQALSGRESLLGATNVDTIESMNSVARVHLERSEVDDATRLFEQARDRLGQADDAPGAASFLIQNGLARAYFAKGREAEAIELLEALETEVRRRPVDSREAPTGSPRASADAKPGPAGTVGPATGPVQLLTELAGTHLAGNRWAEAERLLREVIGLWEQMEHPSWQEDDARSLLGAALMGQGEFAEAEPLLLEGYEGLRKWEGQIPRPAPMILPRAARRLMSLYELTGRDDARRQWAAEFDRVTEAAKE